MWARPRMWPRSARDVSVARIAFALGVLVGLPILALCALTLPGPPSPETAVFGVAALVCVVACLAAPWRNVRPAIVASLAVALLVVAWRGFAAGEGTSVRGSSRFTDRFVPERDVAIGGTALLIATGQMPSDQPGLLDVLRDGYDRMREAEGPVPSAIVGTFVLGQDIDDHSVLRIGTERSDGVVVFLHGFMGSLTLACWQVAQAANPEGLDVVCPATHWEARWAERRGRRTVERTIESLRRDGVRRIYLAGLSAGAIGASQLAPRLDVDGVILISGVSHRARPPRVPTLVLQGGRDRMTPPEPARAYSRHPQVIYEERPDAGHWLILSHHAWATERMRGWLAARER